MLPSVTTRPIQWSKNYCHLYSIFTPACALWGLCPDPHWPQHYHSEETLIWVEGGKQTVQSDMRPCRVLQVGLFWLIHPFGGFVTGREGEYANVLIKRGIPPIVQKICMFPLLRCKTNTFRVDLSELADCRETQHSFLYSSDNSYHGWQSLQHRHFIYNPKQSVSHQSSSEFCHFCKEVFDCTPGSIHYCCKNNSDSEVAPNHFECLFL